MSGMKDLCRDKTMFMQKLPFRHCSWICAIFLFGFCNSHKSPTQAAAPLLPSDSIPYRLETPSKVIRLEEPALREISGLSPTSAPGIFVCIADERGEAFLIDANTGGQVLKRILFKDKGDFESVEMVGKTIWAVKSNGDVYEINNWESDVPAVVEYETFLKKHNDIEGLCYDPKRNALLLACKEDPDSMHARNVYAFSLQSKSLEEKPVYELNPEEVNRYAAYGENERHQFFSPSGIAIHPITGEVYLISTALKRLVVLDYGSGKIKAVQHLDKQVMPQPEGISFDTDGNLYLSSEGKTGEGMLLLFNYTGKK